MLADRLHRTRTDTTRLSLCRFSLLSGSPIARDLEKYIEVFTEDVKCSQSYSIGHRPSFRVSTWLTRTPMFLKREFTILNVTELIVVTHKWEPQSQLRWL